jgi:hypothetical protein
LSVIGAGAIAGVDTLTAVTVAGLTAVAAVVEKLARGFMNDGKLDLEEINSAFSAVDTKAKTESDLKVEAKQNGHDILISAGGAVSYAAATKNDGEVPAEQPVDEDWDKN